MLERTTEWMGVTQYWDEFVIPETGEISGSIIFNDDWDGTIRTFNAEVSDNLNNDWAELLELVGVAMQSTSRGKFDIKWNSVVAPYGPYTGKKLGGYYASARSAGNYLAGLNGATGKIAGGYIDEVRYMKIAGALHKAGKTGAMNAAIFGTTYDSAPYYGETEYAGRWISRGFRDGVAMRP